MLPTSALEYELPERLIATRPVSPRDSARLMVVRRGSGAVEHRRVADLSDLLDADDVLVFNRTRVLPARFVGENLDTGGRVEGLWLEDAPEGAGRWRALVRARRFRPGRRVELKDHAGERTGVILTLIERRGDDGVWEVGVEDPQSRASPAILEAVGWTPLPPYIRSARKSAGIEIADADDQRDYQTVFASEAGPGHWSVAAPTAGLHFTPGLLSRLSARGVERAEVVLDVGAGTFKPIETNAVEEHPMHSEWCSLAESGWVLETGRRVVAVGSTSARTLESFAQRRERGEDTSGWRATELLIAPGYRWRRVDALMTNFHLPRSTLMAMVAAMLPGGVEQLKSLYADAVAKEYRFYSYGDAMLILP